MKKFKLQRVAPFLLATSILLTGCGKKSECDLPNRHVHLYTKNITNNITINAYFDDEHLTRGGYNWTDNTMDITKVDEQIYDLMTNNGLFNGLDNWEYLYYEMANNHDYLEFYYEYETIETYTTTDDKGNVEIHTRTVHHDGWHTNANDSDNTGKTRLYHHRYYGYRIVEGNGKFKLERSPLVDDIREIINDYPYFSEKGYDEVYETFKFSRHELPYLNPEDFECFNHPDLTNTTPTLGKSLTK